MGWHDGQFGGGSFGGPGGFGHDPVWGPWMLVGPLLWLLTPLVIAAVYFWLRRRQARYALAGQPLAAGGSLVADEPSAFELLRRRYVAGEIDAPTFEAMTERLLISERAEELSPPVIRSARYDRYLRRDAWRWQGAHARWGDGPVGGDAPEADSITWL